MIVQLPCHLYARWSLIVTMKNNGVTKMIEQARWTNIFNYDIESMINKKWEHLSPTSKKSFLWIFLITNIVFLFHTVTFFWGNHDWTLIKNGLGATSDMLKLGRFAGGAIQQILGGDILPVANNIFSFIGFSLAAIFLAKYFKIPQTAICYTMFGLFTTTVPYVLPWLWYTKQTTLFWNILFCVWFLILSEKYSLIKSVAAVFLLVFNLGTYASLISTTLIIFLGRILIDILYEEKSLKSLIKDYRNTIINIFLGSIVFCIVLLSLKYLGKIGHGQANTDFISISEVPQKLKSILLCIKETFYYAKPYISKSLLFLMSLPIVATLFIAQKKHVLIKTVIGIILIFICSQITNFLSKQGYYHNMRVDFFSLPFVFSIFIAICLKSEKSIKSIILCLLAVLIYLNVLSDFRFQRVNYLGKLAETEQYQDIKNRIKGSNKIKDKQYILITAGDNAKRMDFYHYNKFKGYAGDVLTHGNVRKWNEKEYYNFYENKQLIKKHFWLDNEKFIPKDTKTLTEIADFILHKAQPYPHKNSVYVDDNYIYIIYNQKGLKRAQKNLYKILKKNNIKSTI